MKITFRIEDDQKLTDEEIKEFKRTGALPATFAAKLYDSIELKGPEGEWTSTKV